MTKEIFPTHYILQSVKSGQEFMDSGWSLDAPDEKEPTLVRAIYEEVQMTPKDNSFGLFRFADWLPINRFLEGSSPPITYKSKGLAKELGLSNLYITFSGYFPEIGATMPTCSFKETEAYSVCARLREGNEDILVVASAGNTARAFARVCSDNKIPLLLCVPEDNLDALWFDKPISNCVKLYCTCSGSDYFDAINLSNNIIGLPGFFAEGGAKNVARRDGMGTTVLSAVDFIKKIPDYYFQAVGSGTGAIAAWEANQRLIIDGRFGTNKMKLMVSQNDPFLPMYDAWKNNSREIVIKDDNEARQQVEEICAKVLSNRKPPYSIAGGLYDALKDTNGTILSATNSQAADAAQLFEKTEKIDIHPAAAIATATLIKETAVGNIPKDAIIMLNITGGGEKRFKQDKKLYFLKPDYFFEINPTIKEIKEVIKK
ncbi:MAG: cysteate synthase [Marinilabiliaceae bacterium]|nr:cysteate synthase [Marinilabiliaceae bacterium]